MKPYQALLIIAIALASVLLGINTDSILQSLNWNRDSRMYFYTNSVKGTFTFAFVGNDSLFLINDYPVQQICHEETATYITPQIFNAIPKNRISFVNSNLTVARATDGDLSCYLLANRTKFKFSSCDNSTYNYGIDETKIINVTSNYLSNFESSYNLH